MASDDTRADYINDMKAQLQELITRYHPAVLWFDGDWTYNTGSPTPTSWWTSSDGAALYDFLVDLDPELIVNERVARGNGLGDFECPEQSVPDTPLSRPWETCQTMNTSWGYASWDSNYKSIDSLIHELVRVVSRDGNYLLNIGPRGDGTLTEQTPPILNGIGNWMTVYGESIYGTTGSPYPAEPEWGYFTKKDGKLFAHVFAWPADGTLKVPSLVNTINKIYLQNDTATVLNFTDSSENIWISVPADAPDAINSVVTIDVSGIPSITSVKAEDHHASAGNRMCGIAVNPARKGVLKIIHEDNSELAVTIYTSIGRKVLHKNVSGKLITLDVHCLPAGIYILKVVHRGYGFTQRFIMY
jgi:alpha-L-fucosidase